MSILAIEVTLLVQSQVCGTSAGCVSSNLMTPFSFRPLPLFSPHERDKTWHDVRPTPSRTRCPRTLDPGVLLAAILVPRARGSQRHAHHPGSDLHLHRIPSAAVRPSSRIDRGKERSLTARAQLHPARAVLDHRRRRRLRRLPPVRDLVLGPLRYAVLGTAPRRAQGVARPRRGRWRAVADGRRAEGRRDGVRGGLRQHSRGRQVPLRLRTSLLGVPRGRRSLTPPRRQRHATRPCSSTSIRAGRSPPPRPRRAQLRPRRQRSTCTSPTRSGARCTPPSSVARGSACPG